MESKILPQWDLNDFYINPQDPEIQKDIEWCSNQTQQFVEKYQNVFSSSDWTTQTLLEAVISFENIQEKMMKIMSYAGLLYYKHLNSPEILAFYQSTNETLTNIGNHLIFFTLDLNKIECSKLEQCFEESPRLIHYKPWIAQVQLYKDHQLSPDLEKILSEKSLTGNLAWIRLYDETLASLRFKMRDETHTLASITNLTAHSDENIRFEASKALSEGLETQSSLFTLITNTLAKDKSIEDHWRRYPNSTSDRHLANQVEPEVVEALVSAVEHNYPKLSHRYYALKAKLLGKEKLEYWDRNAPLPLTDDETTEWDDAKNIVLTAYRSFSPTIADIAQKFFDYNWIDAPALEHKTSGAFSHSTVPSVHPYILLNYLGKQRDIMTLAHELGHGVHQVLAAEQGLLIANTPLTLAETASVFGEMLTFRSLLNSCSDKNKRVQL
jgi:oligoendopeptidase F